MGEKNDPRLPALHDAANQASGAAQRWYLIWLRVSLGLLILGTLLSTILGVWPYDRAALATVSGIAFGCGLIISIYLQQRRFEKDWYGGRALAESVKTRAWRYMAAAEPFPAGLSVEQADKEFAKSLNEILNEKKYLSGALAAKLDNAEQITVDMRDARQSELSNRRDYYVKNRVSNQQDWYGTNSQKNALRAKIWFTIIVLSQIASMIAAFILVRNAGAFNGVGLFAALTTASLSWLQVKKHQELAQSYSLASQELGVVAALGQHVKSDEELSDYVGNAENAISREHTLWVARRD